jgi:hypothetical protein
MPCVCELRDARFLNHSQMLYYLCQDLFETECPCHAIDSNLTSPIVSWPLRVRWKLSRLSPLYFRASCSECKCMLDAWDIWSIQKAQTPLDPTPGFRRDNGTVPTHGWLWDEPGFVRPCCFEKSPLENCHNIYQFKISWNKRIYIYIIKYADYFPMDVLRMMVVLKLRIVHCHPGLICVGHLPALSAQLVQVWMNRTAANKSEAWQLNSWAWWLSEPSIGKWAAQMLDIAAIFLQVLSLRPLK